MLKVLLRLEQLEAAASVVEGLIELPIDARDAPDAFRWQELNLRYLRREIAIGQPLLADALTLTARDALFEDLNRLPDSAA